MKLSHQILAFGLSGAALAALVGAIAIGAASRLGHSVEDMAHATDALQASHQADMMHDAIRADAQLAYLGALENEPAHQAEAGKGLASHSKSYRNAMARLLTLPIAPASRQATLALQPMVERYIGHAEQVVAESGRDVAAARAALPALQSAFNELETHMAALSAGIEAADQAFTSQARAGVFQMLQFIGAVLLLATLVMVVGALWLARQLSGPMAHAEEVAHRLAEGDLTTVITPSGSDEMRRLLQAMGRMQTRFSDIVRGVMSNADEVAAASARIAQGNHDLSGRTDRQSSALEQTAASMCQLGQTVQQNAQNAQQANLLAQTASVVAVKGGEVVGRVVQTMKSINDASRQISEITSVIDSIAFQTNILALNAAVEAARAGEQGRGFAVVAAEVRSLAGRSADAARQIKQLVDASVVRVASGSELADQAGATMSEVVAGIGRVTSLMGEISAASAEQSTGVDQVGKAVTELDHVTRQNVTLVEHSSAAAQDLQTQAERLVQAVAVFRLAAHSAVATH